MGKIFIIKNQTNTFQNFDYGFLLDNHLQKLYLTLCLGRNLFLQTSGNHEERSEQNKSGSRNLCKYRREMCRPLPDTVQVLWQWRYRSPLRQRRLSHWVTSQLKSSIEELRFYTDDFSCIPVHKILVLTWFLFYWNFNLVLMNF